MAQPHIAYTEHLTLESFQGLSCDHASKSWKICRLASIDRWAIGPAHVAR